MVCVDMVSLCTELKLQDYVAVLVDSCQSLQIRQLTTVTCLAMQEKNYPGGHFTTSRI